MFIDKNSLQVKVGNGSYTNLGLYIVEAKYSYNKLWADDSGRNLAGKMTGTFVGVFPKIIVTFRRLTKSELPIITKILDSPRQTIKYYDPTKEAYVEMETYTGDYEVLNNKIITNESNDIKAKKNEQFNVSFIAISKRS